VAGPTKRASAISALDLPLTNMAKISSSRRVKSAGKLGSGVATGVVGVDGGLKTRSKTRPVTSGANKDSPEATTLIAWISCSGPAVLNRKPDDPARNDIGRASCREDEW